MKKSKKLISALAAVVAAGAISVTAFAASNATGYYFKLKCGERGGVDWSGPKEKENNEQKATVTTTGGYVSSTSYININIYDDDQTTLISTTAQVISPSDDYILKYKKLRGAGSDNYLCGRAGYYSAEVAGDWTP